MSRLVWWFFFLDVLDGTERKQWSKKETERKQSIVLVREAKNNRIVTGRHTSSGNLSGVG